VKPTLVLGSSEGVDHGVYIVSKRIQDWASASSIVVVFDLFAAVVGCATRRDKLNKAIVD
jgi:hypothetical protein